MSRSPRWFVTPAPSAYGQQTRVVSAHMTLPLARKSLMAGQVIRRGQKRPGERFLRQMEAAYPPVIGQEVKP